MAGTPRRDQDAVEISWALPPAEHAGLSSPSTSPTDRGQLLPLALPLASSQTSDARQELDSPSPQTHDPASGRGKFLRLFFRCSNQYARALPTPDGAGYLGRCPKCGRTVSFAIGEGGSSDRFFQISCV